MSFYKRDGEELLSAPNFVRGPGFDLFAEQKDTYTYPVDGWTWYDTLDQAMLGLKTAAVTITPLQAKTALHRAGLLPTVEAVIAGADTETQIAWANATEFSRSSPLLNGMAGVVGITPEQLDSLFTAASQIAA